MINEVIWYVDFQFLAYLLIFYNKVSFTKTGQDIKYREQSCFEERPKYIVDLMIID